MGGMWELELYNPYNILSRAKSVHTGFQSFQATLYLEHPMVDCLEIFTQSLPAGFILGRFLADPRMKVQFWNSTLLWRANLSAKLKCGKSQRTLHQVHLVKWI